MCKELTRSLLRSLFIMNIAWRSSMSSLCGCQLHIRQCSPQFFKTDTAWSQNRRHSRAKVKHCRFDANLTGTTIEYQRHASIQISKSVLGRRRTDMHKAVRARSRDRRTRGANQRERNTIAPCCAAQWVRL